MITIIIIGRNKITASNLNVNIININNPSRLYVRIAGANYNLYSLLINSLYLTYDPLYKLLNN